jgi:hypothetical protein
MARLSEKEKEEMLDASARLRDDPPPAAGGDLRFYVPDGPSRLRYARFATAASRFFRGRKPVRFEGNHWLL